MGDQFQEYFPFAFPVFFVLMWFGVTTGLGSASGWYGLMRRYPDRDEGALLELKNLSGTMGTVGMRGILRIAVCPSGLRLGMIRLFGPFCRDFLVPWEEITVSRHDRLLWKSVRLQFGTPSNGALKIFADVADRLARASQGRWPEAGDFPLETGQAAAARIFKAWLAMTLVASAFFIGVPLLVAPPGTGPPLAAAILFPAIVFGIVSLIRYASRDRKN